MAVTQVACAGPSSAESKLPEVGRTSQLMEGLLTTCCGGSGITQLILLVVEKNEVEVGLQPIPRAATLARHCKAHTDFANLRSNAEPLTTPCMSHHWLSEGLHVGLGGTGSNLSLIINRASLPEQT